MKLPRVTITAEQRKELAAAIEGKDVEWGTLFEMALNGLFPNSPRTIKKISAAIQLLFF